MPGVKSHRLGPGSLKFGETGSAVEFAVGVRKFAVEPETEDGDVLDVLSGDSVSEGETDSYKVTGEILQSYDNKSWIAWTWTNAGRTVPFTFRPDNDKALAVTGEVKVRRASVGGDVKQRNTSEFELAGVGAPKLIDAETQQAMTFAPDTTVPEPPEVDPGEWD